MFTAGVVNDHAPRWSPDGSRLAFLSDRTERGVAQIHVIPATGGAAIALTDGKTGVAAFAWSPDGSCLAFTSPDDPTEKDERVPVSHATSFHRALRKIGAPVEMVIYPRAPHGIEERNHQLDLLRRVREWYGKYLRAESEGGRRTTSDPPDRSSR